MRKIISLLPLVVALAGCFSKLKSEDDVPGSYELIYSNGKLTLDVRRDHTFTENLRYVSGSELKVSGKWKLMKGKDLKPWELFTSVEQRIDEVCFDSLIIPIDVRDYGDGKTPTPNWCLAAVKIANKTQFEVNGDEGMAFTLVKNR